MPGPKEDVYDAQISPLMRKILEICIEHKINMVAQFSLDGTMLCTSALPDLDRSDAYSNRLLAITEVMRGDTPLFAVEVGPGGVGLDLVDTLAPKRDGGPRPLEEFLDNLAPKKKDEPS